MTDYDHRSADAAEHAANVQADIDSRYDHGGRVQVIAVTLPPAPVRDCVHCFDDGTPVYPHDEHETRAAYIARQEAALIREALDLYKEANPA